MCNSYKKWKHEHQVSCTMQDVGVYRVLLRTWIQSHYIAFTNIQTSDTIHTMQESEIIFFIFTWNTFQAQAVTVNVKTSILYWSAACTWPVQRETNFSWLYLVYASCNEPNQGSAALQDFATLFLSLNAILVHVWQYLVAISHACKRPIFNTICIFQHSIQYIEHIHSFIHSFILPSILSIHM